MKARQLLMAAVAVVFGLGCEAQYASIDTDQVADDNFDVVSGELSTGVQVGATLVTTGSLNLRSGPGASNAILRVMPSGTRVTALRGSPTTGFYNVKFGTTTGWASGNYLRLDSTSGSGGGSGAGGGGGSTPVPPTAGTPPRYFAFASNPISATKVRTLASRYGGSNIMVGFDSGADYASPLAAARAVGARLHIYVEGPGGVTGSSGWAPDELARVKAAARSVGINTSSSSWMSQWNATGWKLYTRQQLQAFKRQGFESAEIDNLYNGIGDSPTAVVNFLVEYARWYADGSMPRLMLKNIDEDQWASVVPAIRSGRVPRAALSDFHISESDTGNRTEQARLSAQVGIKTLLSNDTYNYDAEGAYDL